MSATGPSAPGASGHERVDERDLYQVLQVDPMASREIIAEAYWVLVRKTQALRTQDPTASEVLQQLNVAYATLVNPDLRLRYSRTPPLDRQQIPNSVPEDGQHKRHPLRERLLGRRHLPGGGRRNAYQILQVDPRAEQPIIAAAYACLRQQYMEGIWNGEVGQETLDELAEGFSILADPEQRASYDAKFLRRREEEATPDPSQPEVAEEEATVPAEPAVEESAAGKTAAGVAAVATTVDWSSLWRKLVRLLGRGIEMSGRAGSYIGRNLYRGTRWLVIDVVAPSARWLVAAAGSRVDALLRRQGLRRSLAPGDDTDLGVRQRVSANSTSLLPAPASPRSPLASEQLGVPMANLVICGGPHTGSTFVVTDRPISLGADPQCDVILEAQANEVAPLHARIWYREGRFMIHQTTDCERIMVGGRPLVWGVLEDGDELRIGRHQLAFKLTRPNATASRGHAKHKSGDKKL